MLHVQMMKPFYCELEGFQMRLVFAYQYFSVKKDEELFQFIPVEGKEIIVNTQNFQVENLSDIFVFQKGNRFIRLPLYQLLLVSDIHMHLQSILQLVDIKPSDVVSDQIQTEVSAIIEEFEMANRERLIDYALIHHDAVLFRKLVNHNGGHIIE